MVRSVVVVVVVVVVVARRLGPELERLHALLPPTSALHVQASLVPSGLAYVVPLRLSCSFCLLMNRIDAFCDSH